MDRSAKRARAVFLTVVVVASLLAVSVALPGTATAQSTVDIEVSDESVAPDNTTTITVSAEEAEHLRVVGDTSGWTVESITPRASMLGNPTTDNVLPYESGDESWFYAESPTDELVIELTATVPDGEYEFTAQELDVADNVVAEEEFTIQVGDGEDDDSTDSSESDDSGETSFSAMNTGGQLVIGGEQTNEIDLEPSQFQIAGVVDEANGTWQSTNVTIKDLETSGFSFSVSVPDGFEGQFDRDTGTASIEGEMVVASFGDEVTLDIAGSTDSAGGNDISEGSVTIVDDTFIVEETGNDLVDSELGLPADNPGENSLQLPLEFEFDDAGAAVPETQVDAVSFEGVTVGERATKMTTVTNTGDRSLNVSAITVDDDVFSVNSSVEEIAAGEEASIQVTFAPTTQGEANATLDVLGPDGALAANATVNGTAVADNSTEGTLSADGPGFGVVGALLAVLTFVVVRRRRVH